MDEFYTVVQQLPTWLSNVLITTPIHIAQHVHEIRLRTGAIPLLTHQGKPTPIADLRLQAKLAPLTQSQLEHIFVHLCGGSVHSYEDELAQGYFTLSGGHRVGVGGRYLQTTNYKSNVISSSPKNTSWQLQQATSLNIRIARHKSIALPMQLLSLLQTHFTSIIILGEPDSGKTTILKNFVSTLTQQNRTVVLLDERAEFDMQGVDTISGMKKSDAVQLALRTLSPEVMVLDELGTLDELVSLEQGFFGGVDFIATLHAASMAEAEQKPQFQYLQSHAMLHTVCLLQGRHAPGQIKQIKQYT